MSDAEAISCTVFRSPRRDYTYVYVREGFKLDDLPPALLQAFGLPEPVIDLELSAERKLANEDVNQVIANLRDKGFHLQLPPTEDPSGWLDLRAGDHELL